MTNPASFTIGPITHSGGVSQTVELDPIDLSRCQSIRAELVLTAAADDGTDLLEVTVESRIKGTDIWNERIRFLPLNGGMTVPEVLVMNVQNRIAIEATEEGYEPTGSEGAAQLPDGAVRNGPFPDKDRRDPEGWVTSWRAVFTVTDGSAAADFEATLNLICGG